MKSIVAYLPYQRHLLIGLVGLVFSTAAWGQGVVSANGLLRVSGNRIVNKNQEPISLAGNSFFWTNDNWGGERYYTPGAVAWLKSDWNATLVRAAMGVEDAGGYLENPSANKNRLKTVVNAAIAQDMYVIIDWHSHHAEQHTEAAIAFFEEMATTYGHREHVIYEIYNEPLKDVSWKDAVKPYAEKVIAAIRAIDPDNLIVIGSPDWSQRVDLVADDPIIGFDNLAYTLHFYTVHHQQWLRDRANQAMAKGIALFVTEWGSIGYTQNDPETKRWMDWCRTNKISHCNWAVNDKKEEWSILVPNASPQGNWPASSLTEAGKLARSIIKYWNADPTVSVEQPKAVQLTLFPNPNHDLLHVRLAEVPATELQLRIVAVNGAELLHRVVPAASDTVQIDVSKLPAGTYQLVLRGSDQHYAASFVKQ